MTSDSKKNSRSKIKKIIKRTTEIVAVILVVFLIGAVISVFVQKAQGKEPSFFGLRIYYIVTDSMEPNIAVKDLILCKNFDGNADGLKKGDVVTFIEDDGALAGNTITHRIVKAPYKDASGEWFIVTKGDNAPSDDKPTPLADVRSVFVGKLPVLTFLYRIISNIYGFIFIIVLPLSALLILQIVRLVKASTKTEKKDENSNEIDEAADKSGFSKQQIEDMMAELKAEKDKEKQTETPADCDEAELEIFDGDDKNCD